MQEFLIEPHIFSTSGLLDPEQFEALDYNRNPHRGLKVSNRNDPGTLSPWQVTHRPRIQLKEKIEIPRFQRLDRPSMAQTDRAGRFRSIFDIEGVRNITHKPLKQIISRIDNKWREYRTLDKEVSLQMDNKTDHTRHKMPLPKALKSKVMELETNEIMPVTIDRKIFKSPGKLSTKHHLVQQINYKEIEESMFRKPMIANRFEILCRKLETKATKLFETISREKVRIINFPVTEEKQTQPCLPSYKKAKSPSTNISLRDYKTLKHNFANTFYMRNKIQKDKRHSNSYIDDACPSQTLDFVEILKAENYKKISEENRRKSNIFSMVLRI